MQLPYIDTLSNKPTFTTTLEDSSMQVYCIKIQIK